MVVVMDKRGAGVMGTQTKVSETRAWEILMSHTDGIDVARRVLAEYFERDADETTGGNVGVESVTVDASGAIITYDA
jgi:hypothetical protein